MKRRLISWFLVTCSLSLVVGVGQTQQPPSKAADALLRIEQIIKTSEATVAKAKPNECWDFAINAADFRAVLEHYPNRMRLDKGSAFFKTDDGKEHVFTLAQQPQPPKRDTVKTPAGKVYHTGRKPLPPEVLKRLAAAAKQRHGDIVQRLPKATAAAYDSRTVGCIPPIRDQSQCGSCWDFSGSGVVGVALIKAGQIPNTSNQPSEQYTLDCGQNGGCGGDDNITVLQWAKATGLPLDKDYGVAYQARSGRCQSTSGMKFYKLQDWGLCTNGGQGVAAVQDIKNAIVAYGCVGAGIDAGVLGDGTQPITGRGHNIDHDIIIVGWVDNSAAAACGLPQSPTGGWWIMRNSWSTSWGQKCANTANPNPVEAGYCYIAWNSGDIGTEACWAVAASAKPPNPWVVGAVGLPRRADVACCGNQLEVKDTVYTAALTLGRAVPAGHYSSPFGNYSGTFDKTVPAGTYAVTLTPLVQQRQLSRCDCGVDPTKCTCGDGITCGCWTFNGRPMDCHMLMPVQHGAGHHCYCGGDPKQCTCTACECAGGKDCHPCDCFKVYRDPQTWKRWMYTTPRGDWDWVSEASGTWCTMPDGSHFWSPSGQCPTIQPLPEQTRTQGFVPPSGGGFRFFGGGGC